jgi:hypothetical protein
VDQNQIKELASFIIHETANDGFALFVEFDGDIKYTSNAAREDMVRAMEEWLEHPMSRKISGSARSELSFNANDPFESYDRIKLERKCIALGEKIGQQTKVCLFLFNFGSRGNLAFYTNMDYARHNIRVWVNNRR